MSGLPGVAPPRPARAGAHTLSPLLAHVRTPVHRDGYALVLNSGITAGIGLVYWMIAARTYPAHVVGVNAALISTMMFLAGISQLNFSNVLVRFVPDAGRSVRRLVILAYAASLVVAGLVASGFVAGLGIWARGLGAVTSISGFRVWFVAATMAWCVFVLQDSVLTGLGRAVWVPVENAVFSAVKLALLVGLATAAPVYGIFASWTGALLASLVPVNFLIFSRLVPRAVRSAARETISVTRRELLRYMVADYVGAVSWLAATTLPPIIVTQVAGAAATAYFSLGWVIAFPIYFAPASVGSSLVVHAVREPEMLGEYARKAFVQGCRIVVPTAAGLVLAAPFLLRLLGHEYAEQSVTVLRLVALAGIPNVVNVLYISVARIERRMSRVVVALTSQCAITLGLAVPLLHLYGITGVGIAWLVGQIAVAVPIVLTRRSAFWPSRRREPAALQGDV
jgi:O-antigen/teichoic acid export membrane protein